MKKVCLIRKQARNHIGHWMDSLGIIPVAWDGWDCSAD